MLAELTNREQASIIELIVTDSDTRFRWMRYLFKDKFADGGGWRLGADGTYFTMGCVTVHLYILPSSRESMVVEEFKKKAAFIFDEKEDKSELGEIFAVNYDEVPTGPAEMILMAAPVPELDPGFFARFAGVRGTYVVGTPGGVNCPQPSWAGHLYALHQLSPVIYLSPQFTRMVRFPKDYVEENPHWPSHMKHTVFDGALTVMARRPEIPAKFGDWGLVLRLNAANARICEGWYHDVMGRGIEPVEAIEASLKSIVKAYVDRNSGTNRKFGAIAEELRMVGIETSANIDEQGQPVNAEDVEILSNEYRSQLFVFVYKCVVTTETLLFQNQANLKPTSGENHFLTLHPRCGYADPHQSLATVFGVNEAVDILKGLPLKALTPAYDMVGSICLLSYLECEELQFLGLDVQKADNKMGVALFQDFADTSTHPIYVVGEQTPLVIERVTDWLHSHIETDPLVLIDDFWAKYKLGAHWARAHISTGSGNRISRPNSPGNVRMSRVFSSISADDAVPATFLQSLIWHPSSNKNLGWALLSMLFIMYDCTFVPLQAFEVEEPATMTYVSSIFWTVDLIFTFFKGYYHHGIIEMRPVRVWEHYLKTWFLLDFVIVAVDWVLLFLFTGVDDTVVILLRMRRILRLARILKVSKVDRILSTIRDFLPGAQFDYTLKIAKLLFTIFGVTHWIACGWFFIAREVGDQDARAITWVRFMHVEDEGIALKYFMSYHWAFSHLLLGEIDVVSMNIWERVFSIAILMLGLLTFSYFVSSITEYMSRIAETQSEHGRQDTAVRRFMEEHAISAVLAAQVDRFRRHSRTNSQRSIVPKEEILGLQDLPESLSIGLSKEVYMPTLGTHGCFQLMDNKDASQTALCAHRVMSEAYFNKDVEIFEKGQRVQLVYIMVKGQAEYRKDDFTCAVEKGGWISEHALWLGGWKRRGELEAQSSVECHALKIQEFQKFCTENIETGFIAYEFALQVANAKVPFSKLHDLVSMTEREMMATKVQAQWVSGNDEDGL